MRIDTAGRFFQVNNACCTYAHACDFAFESKPAPERDALLAMAPPAAGQRVYGTHLFPAASRARFIGVLVTNTEVRCSRCHVLITIRRGHTSVSMLHPIAQHWMVEQPTVVSFRRLTWTGAAYDIDGPEISEIMQQPNSIDSHDVYPGYI